jgi:CRP-like cAMP-binding protein
MDHSLGMITPNRVAFIAHEPLRKLIRQQPGIAERLWRETLIDAAVFREWITNVGSRDAYTRIAHVICEMYVRLHAVGLTNGTTFQFPITQTELADATGLSTVHVNRSIQQIGADEFDRLGARRLHHTGFEGPAGRRDVRAELSAYARQRRGVRGLLPGAWLGDLDSNQD